MSAKEAKARIKINKLLEAAGWRFFDDENGSANIQVEANVKITKKQFDDFAACQRSLAIVQAFWYNGEKEDRREEEWNSGNRITGETW